VIRAVILAIDPGATSGLAVTCPGLPMNVRTITDASERASAVADAVRLASCRELPLIVVAEKWAMRHGKWGTAQASGTAAQWGRWQEALELAGTYRLGRSIFPKTVRVYHATWVSRVLGVSTNVGQERLQRLSLARVKTAGATGDVDDHNAAAAGCIALWAEHAEEVAKMLPKGTVKRGE
jgi:hypothetical protein